MTDAAFVIDFETTDKEPEKAAPVEMALVGVHDTTYLCNLIDPGIPIPPETSAIHHIIDEDVQDKDDWDTIQDDLVDIIQLAYKKSQKPVTLIAHNASYEQGILAKTDFGAPVQWVCTYKCALTVWPDAPGFSNECLRYWLRLPERGRAHMQGTHTALHDCNVTLGIFYSLCALRTIEEMVTISSKPAQYPRIMFGKYRNSPWASVPADYLKWILKQQDMDEGVIYCAEHELARRRGTNDAN